MIGSLKRQAPTFLIAAAVSLIAAGAATADPSVTSKQAQARQVLAQIQQIDGSMERAIQAYDAANIRLATTKHELSTNTLALHVARRDLVRSRQALARRLVQMYTSQSQDDGSGLGVLLGATSLDDLVNRVQNAQSVTHQNEVIVGQVNAARISITRHQRQLQHARAVQAHAVAARAAERTSIEHQLTQRKALLSTIRSQIVQLQAQERARQLQLAAQARARFAAQPPVQATGLGVAASTPDATVAPPSQYGGVVGIAMRYLGTPYVWGGASPSGFDCSGFVMYVYAQVGVSLPHYTGAQWNMGVAVSRDQLEPGDLVFFDGLGHVGIYIGGGQFIHAPHTGDVVKISSLSESWYAANYDGARRITG